MNSSDLVIAETSSSSDEFELSGISNNSSSQRPETNAASVTKDRSLSLKKSHKQSEKKNPRGNHRNRRELKLSRSLFGFSKESNKTSSKSGSWVGGIQSGPKPKAHGKSSVSKLTLQDSHTTEYNGLESHNRHHVREAGSCSREKFDDETNLSLSETQGNSGVHKNETSLDDVPHKKGVLKSCVDVVFATVSQKAGGSQVNFNDAVVISDSESDADTPVDDSNVNKQQNSVSSVKNHDVPEIHQRKSSDSIDDKSWNSAFRNRGANIEAKPGQLQACYITLDSHSDSSDFECPSTFSQKVKTGSQMKQNISDERNSDSLALSRQPNETHESGKKTRRGLAKRSSQATNSSVPPVSNHNSPQIKEKLSPAVKEKDEAAYFDEMRMSLKQNNENPPGKSMELPKPIPQSLISEEFGSSFKDPTHRKIYAKLKKDINESLKYTRPMANTTIRTAISSLQKKQKAKEVVCISDDDETDGLNDFKCDPGKGVQRQCSDTKTSLLNSSLESSKPWTLSKSSTMTYKSDRNEIENGSDLLLIASSLKSEDLSQGKVFPVLARSASDSTLSEEVPHQGEADSQRIDQIHKITDSAVPSLVSISKQTTLSSMPSLQIQPSSFYENEQLEEFSPPDLSQYFTSCTSAVSEESNQVGSSSSTKVTAGKIEKRSSVTADERASLHFSSESTIPDPDMFSDSFFTSPEKTQNNIEGQVKNILKMLDSVDDNDVEPMPEQNSLQNITQENHDKGNNIDIVHSSEQPAELELAELNPNVSVSIAVSAGSCSGSEINLAVVKKEEDIASATDVANATFYSEIDDEIYVLDSDDEEFFQSQSIQHFDCTRKDVFGQRLNSVEEQIDHSNNHVVAENFGDKTAVRRQQEIDDESSSKSVHHTDSDCNISNGDDHLYSGVSAPAVLKGRCGIGSEKSSDVMDINHDFSDVSSDYGDNSNKKNGSSEVVRHNKGFAADDEVSDEDDYCLTQTDDVDDLYFAHTQVDYVTHSDDDLEHAKDGTDHTEDDISPTKNRASFSDDVKENKKLAQESSQNAGVIFESSVSSSDSSDTLDPFSVLTQHCASAVEVQGVDDEEIQAVFSSLDKAIQDLQDLQNESTSLTGEYNPHETETLAVSPPVSEKRIQSTSSVNKDQDRLHVKASSVSSSDSEDTQDPLSTVGGDSQAKDQDPYERETLAVSPPVSEKRIQGTSSINKDQDGFHVKASSVSSSDSEDTQDPLSTVGGDSQAKDQDPYERETLAVSPPVSEKRIQGTSSINKDQDRFHVKASSVSSSDSEDTQDPLSTMGGHSLAKDQDPYERETLAVSYVPNDDQEALFDMETQKHSETTYQSTFNRNTVSILPVLTEDTRDPFNTETEVNFPSLKDQIQNSMKTSAVSTSLSTGEENPFFLQTQKDQPATKTTPCKMREMLFSLHPNGDEEYRKDSEDLFNVETQYAETSVISTSHRGDGDSSRDSERFFTAETQRTESAVLAASPGRSEDSCDDSEKLFNAETQMTQSAALTVSPQMDEDSNKEYKNLFNKETQSAALEVSSEKDDDSSKDSEGMFSVMTQRMKPSVPAISPKRGEYSSDDFVDFLSLPTQKSSSPFQTDHTFYERKTFSLSSSSSEDSQDPYSAETEIDSSSGGESECPYDKESVSSYDLSTEDTQDPYSLETLNDSTPSDGSMSHCRSALADSSASSSKDQENGLFLKSQRSSKNKREPSSREEPVVLPISSEEDKDSSKEQRDLTSEQTNQDCYLASTQIDYPQLTNRNSSARSVVNTQRGLQSALEEQDLSVVETLVNSPMPGSDEHSNEPIDGRDRAGSDGRDKAGNKLKMPEKSCHDFEELKKHIPSLLPNDYRLRDQYLDVSSLSNIQRRNSDVSGSSFRQNLDDRKNHEGGSSCSDVSAISSASDIREVGKHSMAVTSATLNEFPLVKSREQKQPTGGFMALNRSNMVAKTPPEGTKISSSSLKRAAIQENEIPAKRSHLEKVNKIAGNAQGTSRKHHKENEFKEVEPAPKRIKGRSSSDDLKSSWMAVSKRGTYDSNKHNRLDSIKKNVKKSKRQRSMSQETTRSRLTSQVEAAKQALQERRAGPKAAKPVHDHSAVSTHSVSDPYCNSDDVEMPSTQDMMSLGLPILSAQLPVSKKHFAAGLPSQGRVASDEKNQAVVSAGKTETEAKNSNQKVVVPPVPIFTSTNRCMSHLSGGGLPVASTTSETSVSSTAELREPPLAKTVVVSTSEQMQAVGKLTSFKTNSLPASPKQLHQTTTSPQLPTSSCLSDNAHPTPTVHSERTYISGPSSASMKLPAQSSKAKETAHSYKGIIKTSTPKLPGDNNSLPRVNFKASPEVRLFSAPPWTNISELRENAKAKPEAKLHFLTLVLKWNPRWLEERGIIQSLPELFGSGKKIDDVCCRLRMFYSSFQEYVDITLNLLVLECWETIYRDWKMCKQHPPLKIEVLCTVQPQHPYKIPEGRSLIHVDVTGLVAQQDKQKIPSHGDFLIVDFWGAKKLQNNKHDEPKLVQQFAFVHSVSMHNTKLKEIYKLFESSSAVKDRKAVVFSMTLVVQYKGAVFIPSKLHTVQAFSSIKTLERQIDALINLPESPLWAQLLKPSSENVFLHRRVEPNDHLRSKLNKEQATAVSTILQEIPGDPSRQKLFLLQGPPGTGKSHTILALIHQILVKTNFKARICLATPSNAAVDEIAKRIIFFSSRLKKTNLAAISLVRVGNKNRVHPDVRPFMWEELVEQKLSRDAPESLKTELNSLEKQALELEAVLTDPRNSLSLEQKTIKERKRKDLHEQISKLKSHMAPKNANSRGRYNAKCCVLDEAHVVCGTLNSLGSDDLRDIILRSEEHRHRKMPFTCLIIDEATQAIEVDCLIPLRYRMTKVVLVGDQEQLPATVLSQEASEKCLTRSLFERLDLCIREMTKRSVSTVMILTRQYRMHPEILSFPNSFYDDQLVTDESVLARREVIAPYLVFDIQDSRESRDENSRSVSNDGEASCTAQLCQIVRQKVTEIGVICPYVDQQQAVLDHLRKKNLMGIQVNTVDSFQGQERDVIIMSCVRAQSSPSSIGFLADGKRMNVALTRAKQAMYVIGHFSTLRTDDLWKGLYQNAMGRGLLIKVNKLADFRCYAERAVLKLVDKIVH